VRPEERRVIALTGVAHAHDHVVIYVLPPLVAVITRDLGLTEPEFGGVVAAMSFAFGFGALPAGLLEDRIGARIVLPLFLGGAAAALTAASFATTPAGVIAGLIALGAAASLYHPCGLSLITRTVGATVRGRALGYHGIAGNVGEAAAPFLIAGLAAGLGGWRAAFRVLAAMSAALAVATALGLARVAHAGGGHASGSPGPAPGTSAPDAPVPDGPRPVEASASAARWRLALLYLGLVLVGFCYRGALTYLPKLLADRGGDIVGRLFPSGPTKGGVLASLALSAGIISQYAGGRLADRLRNEPLSAVLWVGVAASLLAIGHAGGVGVVLLAFAFAFFYYGQQPATNALVARYTSLRVRGLAYGLSFSASFGVGALGAAFGGFVWQRAGDVGAVYPALAAFALVAAVIFGVLSLRRAPA